MPGSKANPGLKPENQSWRRLYLLLLKIGIREWPTVSALAEQGMGAPLDGVDLEVTVHAEAFAGGPEQSEQDDGEGVEQQQAVAPLRVADVYRRQAHAEAQVLGISEAGLHAPPFSVEVDDLAGRGGAVAGDQAPGFLHVAGVHAYHRTDRALRRGDRRLAQLARPAALADPRRRRAERAVGGPDLGLASRLRGSKLLSRMT